MSLGLFSLLCLGVTTPARVQEPAHRALLIGINKYSRPVGQIAATSWRKDPIPDLTGSENDVDAMRSVLINVYGWSKDTDSKAPSETNDEIIVLKTSQATRQNILAALDHLAATAKPGETLLFFYSGHGSTVKNTLTKKLTYQPSNGPAFGMSNTIVPSDASDGAPDINDKELAEKFNAVIDKQAKLTAVFDSCFSGSIARGTVHSMRTKAAPSILEVDQSIDVKRPDPTVAPYTRPGTLILSAARSFEPAAEYPPSDDIQEPHRGVFAMALTDALLASNGAIDVKDLFAESRARLKSIGYPQEPVIECEGNRETLGFLGEPVGRSKQTRLFVLKHPQSGTDTVTLQGGLDLGIRQGATVEANVNGKSAKAEVIRSSMGSCVAKISLASDETAYQSAVAFTVDTWVSPVSPGLRLFVPRSPMSRDQLGQLAQGVSSSLGTQAVQDPTVQAPTEELEVGQASWQWIRPGGKPTAQPGNPTVASVKGSVKPGDKLFVSYPLGSDFATGLKFGTNPEDLVVEVPNLSSNPDYELVGSWINGNLCYAWVAPNSGSIDPSISQKGLPEERSLDQQVGGMPTRSDWYPADDKLATNLTEAAKQLSNLKNWMTLSSHGADTFPYHAELVEAATSNAVSAGSTVTGYNSDPKDSDKKYLFKLVFTEGGQALNAQKRYVYVMDVDPVWSGTLLYPANGESNLVVPTQDDKPQALGTPFEFTAPLGTERFIVITSAESLNPSLFTFKALTQEKGPSRDGKSALERIISQASAGTRSPKPDPVPSNWSVQYITVQSKLNPTGTP